MSNEPEPLHTHGEALRAIRKKDHRTAADVARYAGMSRQHLYNAESGQCNIDRAKLDRIAEILDVPVTAITCRCTCRCAHDAVGDEPEADRGGGMKTVALGGKYSAGRVALVDDEDYEFVTQHRWLLQEKRPAQRIARYAVTFINRDGRRTSLYMHNLIMGRKGIDHVNHDGLDNQRVNLRPATQWQNEGNQRIHLGPKSSQYKGVCWHRGRGKWIAQIGINHRLRYLGIFTSEGEAALAYNAAALEAFGEFACLNDIQPAEPELLTATEAAARWGVDAEVIVLMAKAHLIASSRTPHGLMLPAAQFTEDAA